MTWQLAKLGGAELWRGGRGAGVTVAVLDSGVTSCIPLPESRLESVSDRGEPTERTSGEHGHNCACLIASEQEGALGIAPEARILSVLVTTSGGAYTISALKRGIRVALDTGSDVISCSLTLPRSDRALTELVREAHLRGVPVIAATGNDPDVDADFPHVVPHSIVVGALDRRAQPMRGRLTEWTDLMTWGETLDVPTRTGTVKPWKGESSGATALVAGVVALALAPVPRGERLRRGQLVEGMLKATAVRSRSGAAPGGTMLKLDAATFIQSLRTAPL